MLKAFREFLKIESASGILLVVAGALAMLVANLPLSGLYGALIDLQVSIRIGNFAIDKPLLLWVNDGLMALFFFTIGLELKREALDGELSDVRKSALPAFGAIGGMLLPAAIYAWINRADEIALKGWAIPAATDIAFTLAVLGLLGSRVPPSVRLFLVSLAIFDDVGAIIIIAIFYTSQLSHSALLAGAACLPVLFALNRSGVVHKTPYLLVGLIMWVAVLKSGVHATLAGVLLAMFIPMRGAGEQPSPLRTLEQDLHPSVAFGILPLFAFVNAGIELGGVSLETLLHPIPLGVAAGLFIGNQVGVFGACWIAVRLGLAQLPAGTAWRHLYGVALLCGVGFTMSLFIASLAFEETRVNLLADERLGILLGSALSAVCGYLMLRFTLPSPAGESVRVRSPGHH